MPAAVTARGPLKVVAVIEPAELLDVLVPDGEPRLVLTIHLPQGAVTADLATKSVRRAIAMVREHGAEAALPSCKAVVRDADRRGRPVGAAEGA